MKKTDIAAVILIASLSVLIAYFAARAIIGDPNNEVVEVYTTTEVSGTLQEPNAEIFNSRAINPTVDIIIGSDSNNERPVDNQDDDDQSADDDDPSGE